MYLTSFFASSWRSASLGLLTHSAADACSQRVTVLMIPSEVPGEGASSESHAVASSAVPEEVVEQHVTFALETKGLRPRRTTGGTEHVYIWTTEHHLAAAAEASAEISVSLQVTSLDSRISADGGVLLLPILPSFVTCI